jgi:hypothetical protein
MKLNFLPKFTNFSDVFSKHEHSVFWFSSRELILVRGNKKKHLALAANSGFADGQVADLGPAVANIKRLYLAAGLKTTSPLDRHSATVFVPTDSSPLERQIIRQAFGQADFQKTNLLDIATALKTFASRQAVNTGVGLYLGQDLSEAVAFTATDQQSFTFNFKKTALKHRMIEFIQNENSLAVSWEMIDKLYETLGQNPELSSYVVRGKNIRDQQVMTLTLSGQQLAAIKALLQQNLKQAWRQLLANKIFTTESLDLWLVVGDPFVYQFMQHQVDKILFLHSELELIQGVQWL